MNGNRKGPENRGMKTGRAMGYCTGHSQPGRCNREDDKDIKHGLSKEHLGQGLGHGHQGQGMGHGHQGRGMGHGRQGRGLGLGRQGRHAFEINTKEEII